MYSTRFKCENVKITTLRTGILKQLRGKAFFIVKVPVALTFDPVTSKSKTVGQRNLKLLGGQAF
jgi:hypothetical protein